MKKFFEEHKKDIIYILIIFICICFSLTSISMCNTERNINKTLNHNIEALSDTITTYKTKNNELVYTKNILLGDINTLKIANKDLYNQLQNMKLKNAELISKITSIIENPIRDTIFEKSVDTLFVKNSFTQPFNFSNRYRELSGNLYFNENKIKMSIDKDIINFDYTLVIDKGTAYITSDNPYVRFTNIQGMQYKQLKPKRWNIGFQAGFGFNYGLLSKSVDLGPFIGIGISYGFSF